MRRRSAKRTDRGGPSGDAPKQRMPDTDLSGLGRDARHLRLDTFVRLRWLAITGQSAAVVGAQAEQLGPTASPSVAEDL